MALYLYWAFLGAVLAISSGLLIVNIVRRSTPGALSLMMMNGLVILWGVFLLLELNADTLAGKRFWNSFLFLSGDISSGFRPITFEELFIGLFVITNFVLTWAVHTGRSGNVITYARDSLFRSLTQGLVVIDKLSQIVEVNEAAVKLMGLEGQKLVGKKFQTVFPELESLQFNFMDASATDEVWHPIQYKERELLVMVSPVVNQRQQPRGWLIQLNDFTEQKNLKRDLESSEAKYRGLADNALDGIVIVQKDQVVYCNQQAAGMVGYRVDEVQEDDFRRFIPADLAVDLHNRFRNHPAVSAAARIFEATLIRKDGLSVPVELNVNRILYRQEAAIVAFIRDISQRKRTEQKLLRLETRLRNFVAQSTDGFFLLDEKGTVIEWNRAMEEITGLPQSQALGRFYPDLYYVMLPLERRHPEEHDHFRDLLVSALQTGEVQRLRSRETEILRADGVRRFTQQQIFPIRTEHGYQIGATTRDVTEQRVAAENVARREAHLQAIFDNSLSMMWMKDPQGRYLAVNRLQAQASGRSVNDVIGKTDYELWDAETAARFTDHDRHTIEARERLIFEELQPTAGGDIWVETMKSPVYDQNGQLIGTIGRSMDITARKQAELALRESEQRFRSMADHAPVMIWMASPGGGVLYLNRSWLDFVGKSLEDEIGEGWYSNIHPEDLPMLTNGFALANEAQRGFSFEFRLRRADGVYRWMYGNTAPRLEPNGNLVGFIGSCLDISEQKERENQLRTFSLAVEQNPASVVITDPGGNIEYVNPKFCQVSGYSFYEVQGKTPRILKSGESQDDFYKHLWETITAGGEWHGIFHNRRKNGELFWERASISAITNGQGEIIHYLGIKEDITLQRLVEQSLQEKSARLEAIFNNPQIGIGLVESSGRYIQVNTRFAEMLGFSGEEMLAQSNLSITHPEDVADTQRLFQALSQGTIAQFYLEKRFVRKDGSVFWGSLTSMPILESDGSFHSYVGFMMDISERKAIAEKLRSSEELYRSIIHASPDDITISDLDGRITMVSPSALRLFGYTTPEELIGRNVGEFLVAEDFEKFKVEAIESLGGGEVGRRMQARGLRSDGSTFFLEATMEIMCGAEGNPEGVVYIVRDVTERLNMEAELRQRVNELEALRATTSELAVELDLSRLLDAMIERLIGLLGAAEGEVALYDEVEGILVNVISHNRDRDYTGVKIRMGEGAMGRAAQDRRTLIVEDYATWEGRSPQFEAIHSSVIAVPLVVHDRLLGAMTIGSPPDTRKFSERDASLAELFAQQVAIAIQNAKLFSEVHRLATLDPLTGVHNRRFFFERAQKELYRSQRYKSILSMILLDIDHFKVINDEFGHTCGDEALRTVARLCREETRDCDLVGRYGGEEFVILLPETGLEGALSVANRLCRRIDTETILTERGEIRLTVSVGVTVLQDAPTTLEQLLDRADQAMYRAKNSGRNQVSV